MKVYLRIRKGQLSELNKQKGKARMNTFYLKYYDEETKECTYESLKLQIYDKPKNFVEKQHNKETILLAEAVRSEKILEIQSGRFGFVSSSSGKIGFLAYFDKMVEKKYDVNGTYGNWKSAFKHLTRHLIDNYIQADESKVISPFEDISLLDLIETDIFKAIEKLPKSIRSNPEAVAETIANNISSKIIEKQLSNPVFFENMSQLLQRLIEEYKKGVLKYKEYLDKMAELAKKVKAEKDDDSLPSEIKTLGMCAIYYYLGKDLGLTIVCESAIQNSKKEGFRENIQKQNEIKEAIYKVIKNEVKTEAIYQIVEQNKQDY